MIDENAILFNDVTIKDVLDLLKKNGFYKDQSGYIGKAGEEFNKPLINMLIYPVKEITIDSGSILEKEYRIGGINLLTGEKLPEITVEARKFPSMGWLSKWGMAVNVFAGQGIKDLIRNQIQCLFSLITQEVKYTHLGMREIQGENFYFHGNGIIVPQNTKLKLNNITVEIQEQRLKNYKLVKNDDLIQDAISQSLQLLQVAPLQITYPLLAITYLAPLCSILKSIGHEPKFVIWVYGATGSRKTTISSLFLSHMGNFSDGTPPSSFKDTVNSLEKRFSLCKDNLIVVDDYFPSTNAYEARMMEQTAQTILRYFGDRVSRGRMKSDTGLYADFPPQGMAIVTGEDLISGHSSMARLFPIEVLRNDVDLKKLTECQQRASLLVHAMHGYIEWLITEQPLKKEEVNEFFSEMRTEYASRLGHGRMLDTIACLLIGLGCFLTFAVSKNVISEEQEQAIYAEAKEIFVSIAETQTHSMQEQRPSEKFLEVVRSLLDSGQIFTKRRPNKSVGRGQVPRRRDANNGGTDVGWHDDQFFYFQPTVLYNNVVQFLRRQSETFSITANMLWKYLEQDGAIEVEFEKDRTHRLVSTRIDTKKSRYLKVKYSALYSDEDNDSNSDGESSPQSPLIFGDDE